MLCLLYQTCTRAIAQHAVCRQQVGNLVFHEFSGRRDGGNGGRAMAGLFELKNELLAKFRLAIDNENVRHTQVTLRADGSFRCPVCDGTATQSRLLAGGIEGEVGSCSTDLWADVVGAENEKAGDFCERDRSRIADGNGGRGGSLQSR